MKKPAESDRGTQGIGLATEHRLPEAFKAKTDPDKDTVEIKRLHHKPVNVSVNSFAAISNLLHIFSPNGEPTLEPGHTIRISDEFTGKSATITANTFMDAAATFQSFIVIKGKYKPSPDLDPVAATPKAAKPAKGKASKITAAVEPKPVTEVAAEPSEEVVPAKVAEPRVKKTSTRKKPATVPAAAEPVVAAKKIKGKTSASSSSKSSAVPSTDPAVMPDWIKAHQKPYVDEDGEFSLEPAALSLAKPKGKVVTGTNNGDAANPAFGYEVTAGGKHVGWVIAEAEDSFIVTGFKDIDPSKHRVLSSAIIRIKVTNLPSLAG